MNGHFNVNLSRCTVTWTSIYHDEPSLGREFITMNGHLNVNLSRWTVIWTWIYHDERSHEREFITMHGHMNVNLSRCTVTWTSIYHDARSPERQFITMHGHLDVRFELLTFYAHNWKQPIRVYSYKRGTAATDNEAMLPTKRNCLSYKITDHCVGSTVLYDALESFQIVVIHVIQNWCFKIRVWSSLTC